MNIAYFTGQVLTRYSWYLARVLVSNKQKITYKWSLIKYINLTSKKEGIASIMPSTKTRSKTAKTASPTKRKWYSKASELIRRIKDKRFQKIDFNTFDEKNRAEFCAKNSRQILSFAEELPKLEEVEALIEEVDYLGIPQQAQELSKLNEAAHEAVSLQREADKLLEKKSTLNLEAALGFLLKEVLLGVQVPNAEELTNIAKLNAELSDALERSITIEELEKLLARGKAAEQIADQELLAGIITLKNNHRKMMSAISDILSTPQLSMIDAPHLRSVILQIETSNFQITELEKLKAIQSIMERVRSTHKLLQGNIDNKMIPEAEEIDFTDCLLKIISKLDEISTLGGLTKEIKQTLSASTEEIKRLTSTIDIDDTELPIFLSKSEGIVWRDNAKELLNLNIDDEVRLNLLLAQAPKELIADGCQEYSQLKERVHAIETALSNEKRISDILAGYWQDEAIEYKIQQVSTFVEESKTFILKHNVERQLDLLLHVAHALKDAAKSNSLDDLVEDARDNGLTETKVFQKMNNLSKASLKAKKHRGWLNTNRKKLNKFRKDNTQPSLSSAQQMPRIKLDQVKTILDALKGLPVCLTTEYAEDIKILEKEIEDIENLENQLSEYSIEYPSAGFSKLEFNQGKLISAYQAHHGLIDAYYNVNYKVPSIEDSLSYINLLIKGNALVKNIKNINIKRDISSWETTMKALKEGIDGKKKSPLVNSMTKRLKMAEQILMEVFKMRQYLNQFVQAGTKQLASQVVNMQGKLPKIEDAVKLLEDFTTGCREIELKDTTEQLTEFINQAKERVFISQSENVSLSDLISLQEQLRKTPLNIEETAYKLSERILRAQSFLKKVKNLNHETLSIRIDSLKTEYSSLKTIIPEFQKIISQMDKEIEINRSIETRFDALKLKEIINLRQEIRNNLYYKDSTLETRLLHRLVDLLEYEYNKNSVKGEEKPIFDLISLIALQRELLENRRIRGKSSPSRDRSGSGKFLIQLITDVKEYLEKNIYTLELKGIDKLDSYFYKNFVDLTNEITDHRIKLQINNRVLPEAAKKSVEKNPARNYDSFGLFGSGFALVSNLPGQNSQVKSSELQNEESSIHQDINTEMDQDQNEGFDEYRPKLHKKRQEFPMFEIKKPAIYGTEVNKQLRQYYTNYIKFWLEKNESFDISGLDALMAAGSIEKQVFEKYSDRLVDYDNICDSISRILKQLIYLVHLSRHIRNKGFQMETILKLTNKDRLALKRIDMMAKNKLEQIDSLNEENTEENQPAIANKTNEDNEELELKFSDAEDEEPAGDDKDFFESDKHDIKTNAHMLSYDPDTKKYIIRRDLAMTKNTPQHNFYKIFSGNIYVEKKERDCAKKIEDIVMYSCTGEDFIRYFSEIPEGLTLTCQLSLFEFEQYIQKVLTSDHALNYLVLPLWMDCPTPLATKNYFKAQGCVASMQYSNRCKIFIFPKEFLREEWLSTINFFIAKKENTSVELVGFIVLKLVDSAGYEISIIPEPQTIDPTQRGHKACKLIKEKGCIFDRQVDLKMLEIAPAAKIPSEHTSSANKRNTMFDDIVNSSESTNGQKKSQKNKLQRLMGGKQVQPTYKSPNTRQKSNLGSGNSSEVFFNESTQSGSNYQSDLLNALKLPGDGVFSSGVSPDNRPPKISENRSKKSILQKRSHPSPNHNSLMNVLKMPDNSISPKKELDDFEQLSRISSEYDPHEVRRTPQEAPRSRLETSVLGKRLIPQEHMLEMRPASVHPSNQIQRGHIQNTHRQGQPVYRQQYQGHGYAKSITRY